MSKLDYGTVRMAFRLILFALALSQSAFLKSILGVGIGWAIGPILVFCFEKEFHTLYVWLRNALWALRDSTIIYLCILGFILLLATRTSHLHVEGLIEVVGIISQKFALFLVFDVPFIGWLAAMEDRAYRRRALLD